MLKTVKVKKQMRLDELIKYIWDNAVVETHFFCCTQDAFLKVSSDGQIYSNYSFRRVDTFTVEVEEEITRSTIFDCLVRVGKDGVVERTHCSISGIKNENTIRIYALLDEELQLIWEAK